MDPRRLAQGKDEECLYVARLLCWYGRRCGLIAKPGRSSAGNRTADDTLSTLTTLTPTRQSMSADLPESVTTVSSAGRSPENIASPSQRPRCIHEVPSPAFILSPLSPRLTTLPSPTFPSALLAESNTTVRYDGLIQLVDEDAEVAAFEKRRRAPAVASPPAEQDASTSDERYARALRLQADLLDRKARLLHEIARWHAQDEA
jgi:hypothetical protein